MQYASTQQQEFQELVLTKSSEMQKKKINAQDVICIFLFSATEVCYTFIIKQQKFFNRGKWQLDVLICISSLTSNIYFLRMFICCLYYFVTQQFFFWGGGNKGGPGRHFQGQESEGTKLRKIYFTNEKLGTHKTHLITHKTLKL